MNNITPWWSSESYWKKMAIWVTAFMFIVLIGLTIDTIPQITAGSERVPAYSVINKHIGYEFNDERNIQVPVIGAEDPLFGKVLSEEEAEALVSHGKKITQGRNCMGCHTLLGNGSYFAPDLTKAWLDPGWSSEPERENLMIEFLMDPIANARSFGSDRMMPNLDISRDEAKAVIAFLKWMSSIDTNGFPYNFTVIDKES
ncbi:cytochrome c [Mariprofundus sp. EBB-1]|uniref:cytochrome c n=1 Tax=Mariprofundus sp. EBB-1 TaxID=2650971 RepID=UPI000EF2163F|nr:cytochrome c [Mariprofundus sp. EBB-1]RLL54775.1 cytochrome c [Mariprofundus sp. EBB-1]